MKKALKPHIRTLLNVWPPFLGAGIRVKRFQSDWKEIDVEMKLRCLELELCGHALRRLALFNG